MIWPNIIILRRGNFASLVTLLHQLQIYVMGLVHDTGNDTFKLRR